MAEPRSEAEVPSASASASASAEETGKEPSPVENALRAWFEGDEIAAGAKLRVITTETPENPVPYHALAVMMYDKKDYPEAARLMNRHRALIAGGQDDYLAVIPILEEYYKKGSVQAQLIYGRAMQGGLAGKGRSLVKAMLAFRRASDGGYAPAQKELGFMRETGIGLVKDAKEAERLYSLAAAKNDPSAMTSLAVMQLNDDTVEKKDAAVSLLESASGMRYADAEMVMAQMCLNGLHYPKDEKEAVKHYEKAAEYGAAEAMNVLARLYEEGTIVEKSSADALKWYKASAECGNANALFRLGVLYYTGNYVKEDHAEAYKCFRKSAELGNTGAWFNVALLCINGDGTDRNPKEARIWFERSARIGNSTAQANLGVMYANGDGVEKDFEEAYFWLTLAKLSGEKGIKGIELVGKELNAEGIDRATRRAHTTYKRIHKQIEEDL